MMSENKIRVRLKELNERLAESQGGSASVVRGKIRELKWVLEEAEPE